MKIDSNVLIMPNGNILKLIDVLEKDVPSGLSLQPEERERLCTRITNYNEITDKNWIDILPPDVVVINNTVLINASHRTDDCRDWDCDFFDETRCECGEAEGGGYGADYQLGYQTTKNVRFLTESEKALIKTIKGKDSK